MVPRTLGILFCGITVYLAEAFNVDVDTAVVHQGKKNTAFGTGAALNFYEGAIKLLITAPKEEHQTQDQSGIFYDCLPSDSSSCTKQTSPAFQTSGGSRNGKFGEAKQLYGMALTVADPNTTVACGPLWQDHRFDHQVSYSFTVGRCQKIPSRDGEQGYVPFYNPKHYVGKHYLIDGMSLFGFSAAGDGKGKVAIGAPGAANFRGKVVILDVGSGTPNQMINSLENEPFVWQGYTVTVGKFCEDDDFCFATSNRQVEGKVDLMNEKFEVLWSKKAEQSYSSFGSALCAMDVDGNEWSDLLVGAPTYSSQVNDSHRYDVGLVYVFVSYNGPIKIGEASFRESSPLKGDQLPFSRFGSAITNIGDINRDSYNDIAVGAPLEDEQAGAVYIYLGSKAGPVDQYAQKIKGSQFQPPLQSFGYHISQATSGLSSYGYPDFAVGAPNSDAVVFLRTRLIINAKVEIRASPNPVNITNNACPDSMDKQRASGCLTVELCFSFTSLSASASHSANDTLEFNVDLKTDTKVSKEALKRLGVYTAQERHALTSHSFPVTVTRGQKGCQINFTVVLLKEQIDRNPFEPVELLASFSLNTTAFPGVSPILNPSQPTNSTQQVNFKNRCGEDKKCAADLVLKGDVEHIPHLPSHPHNVANHTQKLDLVLRVRNRGETSFGLRFTANVSGQIDFRASTGDPNMHCKDADSEVHCDRWVPLQRDKEIEIRLQFLAQSVPLEAHNRLLTFEAQVWPYNPEENPEANNEDNVLRLQSRTVIAADLKMNGWSDPRKHQVESSDQSDVTVAHKLLLVNRGPSFLPTTHLHVSLPAKDSAGALITERVNVTIRVASGWIKECLLSSKAVQNPTTTSSLPSSTSSHSTPSTKSTPSTTTQPTMGGSTPEFEFGEITPARRRRREAGDKDPKGDDNTQLRMDCEEYDCFEYRCLLPPVQPNQQVEVNIKLDIMRSAINFPGDVKTILFTTTTTVDEPSHPLFHPWTSPRQLDVSTRIIWIGSDTTSINIWYIIGGVIGGILLLVIIAVVAWRLGFFVRKDKKRLERLKRQSGFYETNRGSRKSQRSSGSGPRASTSGASTSGADKQ